MSASKNVDQRHVKRIKLMQHLFAAVFDQHPNLDQGQKNREKFQQQESESSQYKLTADESLQQEIEEILVDLEEIDKQIREHAPERPLSEINQVDLAILRLIVWEARHKKTPKKVLIDEAVELAKEFGSESSPRFVNGVLGKLFAQHLSSN